MERQKFLTLINNEHRLAGNSFVEGKILGYAELICELDGGTVEKPDKDGNMRLVHVYYGGWWSEKNDTIKYLETRCSQEQYELFKAYVEEHYPGLCEFYWNSEK